MLTCWLCFTCWNVRLCVWTHFCVYVCLFYLSDCTRLFVSMLRVFFRTSSCIHACVCVVVSDVYTFARNSVNVRKCVRARARSFPSYLCVHVDTNLASMLKH